MRIVTGYKAEAHITSNDDQGRNQGIFGTDRCVLWVGNKMQTTASGANAVQIMDGEAVMKGVHFRIEPGVSETVSVQSAASGKYRADLIVARYTKNGTTGIESVDLVDIKGTEVSSQGAVEWPQYEDGDILGAGATCDMVMARLIVSNAGIISIDPFAGTGNGGYWTLQPMDELHSSINVLQEQAEAEAEAREDGDEALETQIETVEAILESTDESVTLKNITSLASGGSCHVYGNGAGMKLLTFNFQGAVAGTSEVAIGTLSTRYRPAQNFFRVGVTQKGNKYILVIRTNGNIGIQMIDEIDTSIVGNLSNWYRETVAYWT